MIFVKTYFILNILTYITWVHATSECIPRSYGQDSFVCVCNSTYCDFQSKLSPIEKGKFAWICSDRNQLRMKLYSGTIQSVPNYDYSSSNIKVINVNHTQRFQRIRGWGGSITDSVGINILSLSPGAQKLIMKSYFSKEGIDYNLIRTPIGGTDFSTRGYTLDDHPDDVELKKFSLQKEDLFYKIPFLQQALIENPTTRLVATVWSAPTWMKKNHLLKASGEKSGALLKKYYQTLANYYIKFLDAYKDHGLNFWMIAPSNEPMSGTMIGANNNMKWSFNDSAKWVAENMGPTLAASSHKTKMYAFEDQRPYLSKYVNSLYMNPQVKKYIHAIGLHWYYDFVADPVILNEIHEKVPEQFFLITEACTGFLPWQRVSLGSWKRAEKLLEKIFENINHWVCGWIDWNLVLNEEGGPTYINNFIDAPIIVNATRNEFYKQPLFYAMGHFSKFVPRNSVKIFSTNYITLFTAAFETPDSSTVIQIYNAKVTAQRVLIKDDEDNLISINLNPKSINTIIYKR